MAAAPPPVVYGTTDMCPVPLNSPSLTALEAAVIEVEPHQNIPVLWVVL